MLPEVDMIDCISVENMRNSDAYTIQNFTSGKELMYRAAYGVFLSCPWHGRIGIVAGSGNNGGDGFALAVILKEKGYDCTVFTISTRMSEDSAFYANAASDSGVSIQPYARGALSGFDILVDCLLGTGFRGAVRPDYAAAIEEINTSSADVISVDINSGMNGDTGEAELAIYSDLTVTIGFVKSGLIAPEAGRFMKRLVCVDIGIHLLQAEGKILSSEEWMSGSFRGSDCHLCPEWLDMDVKKVY